MKFNSVRSLRVLSEWLVKSPQGGSAIDLNLGYRGIGSVPVDFVDFYRCYQFWSLFKELQEEDLAKVAERFPNWLPYLLKWNFLMSLCKEYSSSRDENHKRNLRCLISSTTDEAYRKSLSICKSVREKRSKSHEGPDQSSPTSSEQSQKEPDELDGDKLSHEGLSFS